MSDMNAKMGVLKELRKKAMDNMGEPLKGGLKKVTVAAPDDEGLKMGLDKAEDMVESSEPEEDIEQAYGEENEKALGNDKKDGFLQKLLDMCSSPEEIDEKIQFLQKAKDEMYPSEDSESEPNPFEGM